MYMDVAEIVTEMNKIWKFSAYEMGAGCDMMETQCKAYTSKFPSQ